MGQPIRSARGEVVDFALLAIKQQLSAAPVPKAVEQRKLAIDEKDGIKTTVQPDLDFMALSEEAAVQSAKASSDVKGQQLKRK